MDALKSSASKKLIDSLEGLLSLYNILFDHLKRERELLIASDIENLVSSNATKEALLKKIALRNEIREQAAQSLAQQMGLKSTVPRLLELAEKSTDVELAAELKRYHQILNLTIERVTELNRENDVFTQSALRSLKRALVNVKDTLTGKKTYEKKGKMNEGPLQAGNFVSKEA
jgi:flagellar biosynthesis/type III secretory pathway chaperone